MSPIDREKMHHELLEALYTARRRVEALEAALAHNAACLGTGIERDGQIGRAAPDCASLPDALARSLELTQPEEDISNFIGREGHEESRPRLGNDVPREVRPDKQPAVSPLVGQLALGHPADAITFDLSPNPAEESPEFSVSPGRPESGESETPPGRPRGRARHSASRNAAPGSEMSSSSDAPVRLCSESRDNAGAEPGCSICREAVTPGAECPFRGRHGSGRACLVLEVINDGIWDWNLRTGELYCSPRWEAITGRSGNGPGSPLDALTSLLQPADAVNLRQRFMQLIEGTADRIRAAVRFRRDSGWGWGWGVLRVMAVRREGEVARIIAVLADITAQREAEIAYYSSNKKIRALADGSPDVIIRIDRDGRLLYVSPTISRYFAVTPREMIGRPLLEFDLSGGRGFFLKNVRAVFASARHGQSEIVLDSPLAGKILAACRFWPEFDADGQVVSVSVLMRDMTFSQRLVHNYYALFNRMEDGFILFEHVQAWEGRVSSYGPEEFALVVMNPAFSRMFAMESPDITGSGMRGLLGEEADQWAVCLKKVLVGGRPVHQKMHLASGDYEISAYSPERGRVACIVKDSTELLKIEHETRLNEARFAALHRLSHMDAASEDAVMRYSLEQAVKLTGSAFGYLHVAGRHEDEKGHVYWSKGLNGQEHAGSENGVMLLPWTEHEKPRAIRHSEVVNAARGNLSRAVGEDITIERYTAAPIIDEGRIVCLVSVANKKAPYTSSDLRHLELFVNGMWFHLRRRWSVEALRKAKEEAEAASRAKNEFLANVSHELRTPLNGILGMLQILRQSSLTPGQMEYVVTADDSGRSLLRIISDILDCSRIEAGRFELVPRLFDFSAMVRSTCAMFSHQAKQSRIHFSLRLDPAIPKLLLGDDARVRQVICNLVGNAFKFTRQGEISVECAFLPYCRKGFRCMYLAVADTGIGIPDDKLDAIFHVFTQLDSSITRSRSGTGLGLAIAKRLVNMMNGSITVESVPGKGTTVHCSLLFEEPGSVEKGTAVHPPPRQDVRPLDLLVVENDPVSQFALRALLKKQGHDCVCVNDGKQALEALLQRSFECIITDIQMPVMDGMEMTRRIREGDCADIEPPAGVAALPGTGSRDHRPAIPRDIPIIAVTAHAMAGDEKRFLDMGVDYYLAKPVDGAELAAVLANVSALLRARGGT